MNFLSQRGGIEEIDYNLETEEWIKLSSTFLNEKPYLQLLKLLVEIKKQKLNLYLNSIKVRVFFEKKYRKKALVPSC